MIGTIARLLLREAPSIISLLKQRRKEETAIQLLNPNWNPTAEVNFSNGKRQPAVTKKQAEALIKQALECRTPVDTDRELAALDLLERIIAR